MEMETFNFLVCCGGLLGLMLSAPLLIVKKSIATTLLGIYNLVLTVSFIEPVIKMLSPSLVAIATILIATATFMLGPCLYLYVRHRISNVHQWKNRQLLHFIPATVILLLTTLGTLLSSSGEDGVTEALLYAFFVISLMTYSVESLMLILRNRNKGNVRYPKGIQFAFLLFLVITSIVLFGFSTLYTLLGFTLTHAFVISIQAILMFIIVGISFLNPELSPKHRWN
jgi:hypothetical protein